MLLFFALAACDPTNETALLAIRPAHPAPYWRDRDQFPCGTEEGWGACMDASVVLEPRIGGVIVPVDPLPYDATDESGLWVGASIHDPWPVEAGESLRVPYVLCVSCWDGDPAPPAGEYDFPLTWALCDDAAGLPVIATASAEVVVRLLE